MELRLDLKSPELELELELKSLELELELKLIVSSGIGIGIGIENNGSGIDPNPALEQRITQSFHTQWASLSPYRRYWYSLPNL